MGQKATMRSGGWAVILVCGVGSTLAGAAAPAPDLSGLYARQQAELSILEGRNETLVNYGASFAQGQSEGTCECALVVQKKAADRWTLKDVDGEGTWTLRVTPQQLTLESAQPPECCGAGWPGSGAFARASVKPPTRCQVVAPKAYFHDADARNTQRKAFVLARDAVQVYVPGTEPAFIPGRFVGPQVATVGWLKREELQCGAAAVDAQALAGTWWRVQKQGKGYVVSKPCDAAIPHFTLAADGQGDIDYGQEQEKLRVTALTPGASGAYTLTLTPGGPLTWSVVDARRGIVRVQGGEGFFGAGPLFVREAQKAALPQKTESCE
ncbi:hypothetical protein [Archangium primigenium]|uniref:hypothetical protein n=1 Tax=[Archangium] primigenium TaxID=2792470 RepID=UPI00195CDD1F|nr:hypothetical protein [Archangium primigenium]MBM7119043.1 hypothetical protein [Archangium primigenium]